MARQDDFAQKSRPPTSAFEDWIDGTAFSCLGARASLRQKQLYCVELKSMLDLDSTRELHREIVGFVDRTRLHETRFSSFAAIFENPRRLSEVEFEHTLWTQLAMLRQVDREKYAWAPGVSSDPHALDFAYSVAGHPFFVVGLHSQASRISRRFTHPVLVFNSHKQFDQLKQDGLYASLQDKIRARELRLQGSINPNLADFGEQPEALQYSGRPQPAEWRCPISGASATFDGMAR
ncbi:guanitoxin biosynthesis heme-dependent pre-guanitoxin N-hydroxylase GntA [Micromonospora sp. DT44]|uniref:guanitoxin biosynthesis heme-dependent pre-guanitoxin N-hydroxylase GntA n=1 Tax=Micromonospora sp. DT44 TaxID=3393439 RepID=UPI003CF74C15